MFDSGKQNLHILQLPRFKIARLSWSVDLITDLPCSDNGFKILLVAVDDFSNFLLAIPLVSTTSEDLDILVQGAEPLFFLDYFACGKLDVDTGEAVVSGIATGCELSGCALIGGETAEMPGMYPPGEYDLAGFAVGVAEKAKLITGQTIQPGDTVLGLASSGPHSNGYSLVRKLLEVSGADLAADFHGQPFGHALLEPTRIYVKPLLALMAELEIKGMAHITGGGLTENIPRVLPDGTAVAIEVASWTLPPVFQWLQQAGHVSDLEMRRTFNCGIGMVVIVASGDAERAAGFLTARGETVYRLGEVVATDAVPHVQYR